MPRRNITGNHELAGVLRASNQNIKADLTDYLNRYSSNMDKLNSKFSKLADSLDEPLNELRGCQEQNLKRVQQSQKFTGQCWDAMESESLEEMIKKRDLVKKQRNN